MIRFFQHRFRYVDLPTAAACAFLLVANAVYPDRVLAEFDETEVFGGTTIEALMGGGEASRSKRPHEAPAQPWSWPARAPQPAPEASAPAPAPPADPGSVQTLPEPIPTGDVQKETSAFPVGTPPAAPLLPAGDAQKEAPPAPQGQSNPAAEPILEKLPVEDSASMVNRAAELEQNGDPSAAFEAYKAALEKASTAKDQKATAAVLSALARVSHQLRKDKEALEYLNRAIELNKTLKNARARSLDFLLAGRIQMSLADYPGAIKSFEEALKLLPESEAAERPKLLESTGTCLLRLHRHGEAISALNRALTCLARESNQAESARIHLLVGETHLSRSDYSAAKANFTKALKLYRDANSAKEVGETLFRLAYVDHLQGNLAESRKAMEEGKALLGEPHAGNSALPLLVSGMVLSAEGKLVQATNCLNAALRLYEEAGDAIMAARVRLRLASIDADRAKFESALALAGKALHEFRSLSVQGGEAAALRQIGEVYFRQGFVHKALEYADASLAVSKRVNDRNQAALTRALLAEIHGSTGDPETASKLLKDAVEDVKAGVDRRARATVRLALARFRLSRGNAERALQDAADARTEFGEQNDRRAMADCDHLSGLAYELQGRRDLAEKAFAQALESHRALSDRFGEGRDLTALGVYYKHIGDHDKALQHFNRALDLAKGIGDRRGHAANLANIGNVLRHSNRIVDGVQHLDQALAIYRDLSDRKGEADILTNLGNAEAARGAQSTALEQFNAALAIQRQIQDSRGAATNLTSMGRLYLAKGDLKNASASLEEAAKINKRINNQAGEMAILTEQAMLQRAKGNAGEALSLLNKAMSLARSLNEARALSSIRLKMATVLEDTGEYGKALALLQETLTEMRQQGDRQGELWALSGIAVVQVKTEDYEKALPNLHKALKLLSELGLPASQSTDLHYYLGEIYEGFRDFERALGHYHKALTSCQTHGNYSDLAKIDDRIANVYYMTENYARSKDFFEDALRLNTDLRDLEKQKTELIRLGDILSKLGDAEAALKRHQQALAITRETKDERTEARVLTRMGTLYQVLGRPRVALDSYREASEIRTKIGDRRGVNENLLQMALVTSILGGFDAAVADLKRAFVISQNSEDRGMLWKAYFIMGRALEEKNSLGEALESYRKAITILEAMEADIVEESDEDDFIFGGKNALFETTLRVMMRLARKDPEGAYDAQALRIVEKLKAAEFENILAKINVSAFSDLPKELLIKEKSLKLSLRKLHSRLAAELSRVNRDQAQIKRILEERRLKEAAFRELKDRLTKEYPSYADLRFPKPISVHQLQKDVIRPEEALLIYMVTRARTYLFAIDKNRFHAHSIQYSSKEMERDIETLIKPLHRSDTPSNWDPSVAHRLYSKLIAPVEYFLAAKKAVVVVPHGPLASLPFEILVSSKGHAGKRFWSANDRPTYLVENYAFSYAPSATVLSSVRARKHGKEPGWSLAAFGDAQYTDPTKTKDLNPGADRLLTTVAQAAPPSPRPALRSLPGARREMSEIAKLMGGPTQVYVGDQATESLFKKADLSRYSYIHLATHGTLVSGSGKFQQQPAILFSLFGDRENDGFLQLGEVFGLKLNSDLVVLSSCLPSDPPYTAEGDGILALSRAFLFAGTDSVILSLWQVNDDSTAKLFIDMYRNLGEGSKAEALRRAKLALLANPTTSHPYYWAPFILMGEWTVAFPPSHLKPDQQRMRFQGVSAWRRLLSM